MGVALPGKEIGTEDATVTDTGRVIFTLLVSDLFFAILNDIKFFFYYRSLFNRLLSMDMLLR